MRNKIFGVVGMIWGAAVVVNSLFGPVPESSDAYHSGYSGAVVFGILMFITGAYYLVKKTQ